MNLTIDTIDVKRLKQLVQVKLRSLDDARTPMSQASIQMYKSVMQNFREEGTDKQKWKPLSPVALAMRRRGKKSGSPKILQDSGRLVGSVVPDFGVDYASVGTNVSYGPLHQRGGMASFPGRHIEPRKAGGVLHFKGKDGKDVFVKHAYVPPVRKFVPARPFLWLRQDYYNKIITIVERWFKEMPNV